MSDPRQGTVTWDQAFTAGATPGSQVTYSHNYNRRAIEVWGVDVVSGRRLSSSELFVDQPSANQIVVANIQVGPALVKVFARFRVYSMESAPIASNSPALSTQVGPPPSGGGSVTGSGAATQIAYWNSPTSITGENDLWWDATNNRLGVLTNTPLASLSIGASNQFRVQGSNGDLIRIKDVPYVWPAANAAGALTNDGAGNLTWTPSGAGSTSAVVSATAYNCPIGVVVGDAVYLSAADTVDKADADDASKQPLIGFVISKPTAVTCVVQYHGEMAGVLAGLTPGATYYLTATPGVISTVAPTVSGNIVQKVGFARNATTLVVFVDRDFTELI